MNETNSQVEFKDLQPSHAQQIAALHIESISTGFISSLGIDFVASLYEAIARSKSSFGFVAEKDGKVLGFVAFTTNLNKLYKSVILKKGLLFALLLAGKMVSFERIKRVFETLFYPGRIKRDPALREPKMNLPAAELLSIAIARQERRKGLAGQLIKKGFQHFQKEGIDKVKVLIGADNKPGNKLYLKFGFELVGQIVNHGVVSNIYVAQTSSL
jgi:ribosomal protein S18 acetylase RimI-like enzyme